MKSLLTDEIKYGINFSLSETSVLYFRDFFFIISGIKLIIDAIIRGYASHSVYG